MKKLLAIVLVLALLLPSLALADVDLSGMSYDELVALKEKINLALWSSNEWEEVTVPIGVYEIGRDIPVGYWNISVPPTEYTILTWAKALDESKKSADYGDYLFSSGIMSKTFKNYADFNGDYPESVDLELTKGTYIIVERGNVVFSPYSGGKDLGFK
ncbi:MAG: hypothetical protein PHY64_01290 [Eubacteriales bacterium]|nr:hypothetical protein [Eubacteriales bacterium]